MSIKSRQQRRCLSFTPAVYRRIREYCEAFKIPMSQFIEERIDEAIGKPFATSREVLS